MHDTGVGIPPEFLPHVFERFSQADMTIQRKHGGLGLGLSIARHLVDQHGGTISVDSHGLGRGATFTVELPLSPGPAEAPVERPAVAMFRPTLDSVRALVVENDADSRELLVVALELAGAAVIQVTSVAEAFTAIASSTPDVVVCDIGLPEEDGFAFMKRLRTFAPDAGGTIPAAALTAYTRPEDRRLALEAGYDVYLPKPVEPSELVAAIGQASRESGELSADSAAPAESANAGTSPAAPPGIDCVCRGRPHARREQANSRGRRQRGIAGLFSLRAW